MEVEVQKEKKMHIELSNILELIAKAKEMGRKVVKVTFLDPIAYEELKALGYNPIEEADDEFEIRWA